MNLEEIEKLTIEYGEDRGITHCRRLFKLIEMIGCDLAYSEENLQYAVFLHDWGAYKKYIQAGVDHAFRSAQVAREEILPQTDLSAEAVSIILEAIELHDYRNKLPVVSNEALLLREADFLDFLGVIGVARELVRGGNNIQPALQQVKKRKEYIQDRFTLPAAKEIARQRIKEMDEFIRLLEQEGFGYL
ncbi:MAG: HD domain-containing protein [Chloroflexi bacterium]|nr:MAG: HD domain-containing protein [Chloroflexota bacterium]